MKLQKKETTRYKSAKSVSELQKEGLQEEEQGSEQGRRQTGDGLNTDPPGNAAVCRCWGRSTTSGGRWEQGRGTHGLSTESLEGVGPGRISVDGEHHSAGTVVGLSTVNPNCLGIIHGDGESGEVCNAIANGFAGREGKVSWKRPLLRDSYSQSRSEASVQGLAWIGEGGLSGSMVLLMELEGDGVSWLSDNGVGLEREIVRATNDNTVVSGGGGRLRVYNDGGGGRSGEGRRGGG